MAVTTAAYVRASKTDQDADLQRRGIERFAEYADLDVTDWYYDEGISGRTETRPELHRLMEAPRRREVDCVGVWKFDRFARSASHLIRALDAFNHLGIRFVSVLSPLVFLGVGLGALDLAAGAVTWQSLTTVRVGPALLLRSD